MFRNGDIGEQIEKVGVQTQTRSGVRLGQLYQADRGDKGTRALSALFSTLLGKFS